MGQQWNTNKQSIFFYLRIIARFTRSTDGDCKYDSFYISITTLLSIRGKLEKKVGAALRSWYWWYLYFFLLGTGMRMGKIGIKDQH